jgi:hypothetical protein
MYRVKASGRVPSETQRSLDPSGSRSRSVWVLFGACSLLLVAFFLFVFFTHDIYILSRSWGVPSMVARAGGLLASRRLMDSVVFDLCRGPGTVAR